MTQPLSLHRRTLLAAGLAGLCTPLGGCFRRITINYRLTLWVEAYGRTLSGSSVQQLMWRSWSTELGSRKSSFSGNLGEGAIVDLGDHGVVASTFVTLPDPDAPPGQWDREILDRWGGRPPATRGWNSVTDLLADGLGIARDADVDDTTHLDRLAALDTSDPISVAPGALPLLVWFPEPDAPASVRRLDPFATNGQVTLTGAALQVVRTPPTAGTAQRSLPWLTPYYQQRLNFLGGYALNARDVGSALQPEEIWRFPPRK